MHALKDWVIRVFCFIFILILASLQLHTPSPPQQTLSLAEKEITCLKRNIYEESRGEGKLGQQLVAYITVQRSLEPGYGGNTVCDVVYAQMGVYKAVQFSWTTSTTAKSAPRDPVAYELAQRYAVEALTKGGSPDPRFTHARFYLNPRDADRSNVCKFKKNYVHVGDVESHSFYRLRQKYDPAPLTEVQIRECRPVRMASTPPLPLPPPPPPKPPKMKLHRVD